GPIAGAIDEAQDLARVGQGDQQGMVAPDAVVGDVHAFFALAGGGDQAAIDVEDGLLEEGGRLAAPQSDADVVESVLHGVGAGGVKTAAEVAGGGGIGNALGAEGVEEDSVVAAQLDVLQTVAVAQGVVGDVEHVIGLVVRQMDLEHMQASVDVVDEADL